MSTITTAAALSHGYANMSRNRVKTIGETSGLIQYNNNSNSQINQIRSGNGQYRINRSHQNMHIIASEQRSHHNNNNRGSRRYSESGHDQQEQYDERDARRERYQSLNTNNNNNRNGNSGLMIK